MDRPAIISLTFDDGLRCQFERAVPVLDRHGFAATFFLVANTDPIHTDRRPHPAWSKINWSEDDTRLLKSIAQRGHEIGAHSLTHRRPELDQSPKDEAEGSKNWIETRLGKPTPSYCYPFYHITRPIEDAVFGAGYKQARGGPQGSHYQHCPSDWFNVDSRQISTTEKENVGGWIRPSCWYVLTYHGIGDDRDGWKPITVAEFTRQMEELATHRDSGAVEVVTFNDGAERLRQPK